MTSFPKAIARRNRYLACTTIVLYIYTIYTYHTLNVHHEVDVVEVMECLIWVKASLCPMRRHHTTVYLPIIHTKRSLDSTQHQIQHLDMCIYMYTHDIHKILSVDVCDRERERDDVNVRVERCTCVYMCVGEFVCGCERTWDRLIPSWQTGTSVSCSLIAKVGAEDTPVDMSSDDGPHTMLPPRRLNSITFSTISLLRNTRRFYIQYMKKTVNKKNNLVLL